MNDLPIVLHGTIEFPLPTYRGSWSHRPFKIPKRTKNNATTTDTDTDTDTDNNKLYLIDTFRTPIAQLFELNEFIRNFRTQTNSSEKSLISDLCVHAGELASRERPTLFNKHFLPEFNCLYLSPTNFWSNDLNSFLSDDDIMETINVDIKNETISTTSQQPHIRDLLFSVSWPHALVSLQNHSSTILFTYAITIALKKYDKPFLDQLKAKLSKKFNLKLNKHEDENYMGAYFLLSLLVSMLWYTTS
jgi:hypothetical protein